VRGRPPEYVQFVDGDCEVVPGWIETAAEFLDARPGVAIAAGRLRERFPEATIYNRLADAEWAKPVGRAAAAGGIMLARCRAVAEAGGFNPALIAGEEPELCLRLRRAGWEIWQLDAEMALHDIAMTRFSQWWKRTRRAGHTYAEGAALYGRGRSATTWRACGGRCSGARACRWRRRWGAGDALGAC
jgi:GT2 family glycosyltransferase